jgi:hypothetical protein
MNMQTPTIYIEDKNSSHGTYVNGIHIKTIKHPLKSGDKLRFGSEVMRGTGKPLHFVVLAAVRWWAPGHTARTSNMNTRITYITNSTAANLCSATETFKPPVFELKITEIGNAPTMVDSATEPGLTITFPEDSGESEREDDVYSEVESDNESQSSVIALDVTPKKTNGSVLFTSPSSLLTPPKAFDIFTY